MMKDLTGERFGRWLVVEHSHVKAKNHYWLCRCDCGREKAVGVSGLKTGLSRSCGCLMRELAKTRQLRHGGAAGKKSGEYQVWSQMKHRCENPDANGFANYGGRGIKVCERWKGEDGFINFVADMGARPSLSYTLDRFPNNDGDYEPGNCRWATSKEQSRNKRSNHLLTYDGETRCLTEWSEITGIFLGTLAMRVRLGWDAESIVNTPVNPKQSLQMLTCDGETLPISEWAKRTGIKPATIHYRLNFAGWSMADAVKTPTQISKRRIRDR
jgi:hypothetical protein